MNDDTRRLIYGTIVAFLVFILSWVGFVYISACGFTFTCVQGAPLVERTPIPTLIPVKGSQPHPVANAAKSNQCKVAATDLIGAWITTGHSETEPFPFTDLKGQSCEGTFADIQPLFVENSVWFPGSLGCISCHNADLTDRSAGLDLTSYQALSLGTKRVSRFYLTWHRHFWRRRFGKIPTLSSADQAGTGTSGSFTGCTSTLNDLVCRSISYCR